MRRYVFLPLALLPFGCTSSSAPEPVRSFDRPDALEAICVETRDKDGRTLSEPNVKPMTECQELKSTTASAPGLTGSDMPAARPVILVTQVGRGELALVDVASAVVLDADRGTPGLNSVPAAAEPTAVRVSPDAQTVLLASGAPRAYGVYALPSRKLVAHALTGKGSPIGLPDWVGCKLPERPVAIEWMADDTLAVLTSGGDGAAAKLVAMSAAPFTENGRSALVPGELDNCQVISATSLGPAAPPSSWPASTSFASGMPGQPMSSAALPLGPPNACTSSGVVASAASSPLPIASLMRKDGTMLFIGERSRALVHVIDMSDAAQPKLLKQLSFAGEVEGSWAKDVAISPTTRDGKQYAYVIDGLDGALAVFDLSDAAQVLRPMDRPRAATSPLQRPDRLRMSAPALAVRSFARDWTDDKKQHPVADATQAVLCTPNPSQSATLGASYLNNGTYSAAVLGPTRMRGVFAAVALTNGDVVFVDVDDWDAPCRRPANTSSSAQVNAFGDAQNSDPTSPWGVPLVDAVKVSDEWFYPAVAPHRLRSAYRLNINDTDGTHAPNLAGTPSLSLSRQPLAINGEQALELPTLMPTRSDTADPGWKFFGPSAQTDSNNVAAMTPGSSVAVPRVRFSWEDPTVHTNETWNVVYEGILPGLDRVSGTVSAGTGSELILETGTPGLCAAGIEDIKVGSARGALADAEAQRLGLSTTNFAARTGDYVRITSELLEQSDPYWSIPADPQACWGDVSDPRARRELCAATFGDSNANAYTRDLPVLEAYDDHLVVGQYAYGSGQDRNRRLAPTYDRSFSDRVRCCFHGQLNVAVRSGGEWIASGSTSKLLHHVVKGAGDRCELSCEANRRLADARAFSVPRPSAAGFVPPLATSPLAFRNPMFSFVMYAPTSKPIATDMTWKFDVRGGFVPLGFSVATKLGSTNLNLRALDVYPGLGEFVALDASTQGLVFVRLDTLVQARPVIY